MSVSGGRIELHTEELREKFDRSFALPNVHDVEEKEPLLMLRLGGDPYAIRLHEVTEIIEGRRILPVPAATDDLLGLSGIRGGIVPVFGLATLLGYHQASVTPRWMLLCDAEDPVALAFSDFDGYVRLPRSSLHADEGTRVVRQHVTEVLRTDTGVRAVISVALVLKAIRNLVSKAISTQGKRSST